MKITVFAEMPRHHYENKECLEAYPEGLGAALQGIFAGDHAVTLIEQKEGDDGRALLPVLADTDVLVWWGHALHNAVSDEVTDAVCRSVLRGMGFMPLHSSHKAKPFMRLIGTSGSLKWREAGESERLWIIEPGHPIANGLPEYIDIPREEMYGEPFDIPVPDELLILGWFTGGEVFRSGCVFHRGRGKVFYFQPGHESYPVYKLPLIAKILNSAAAYIKCASGILPNDAECPNAQPLEKL